MAVYGAIECSVMSQSFLAGLDWESEKLGGPVFGNNRQRPGKFSFAELVGELVKDEIVASVSSRRGCGGDRHS